MLVAVIGAILGLAGAFATTRLLAGLLHEVSPTDPLTYAAVSITVVTVARRASYIPARRASRVDPIAALRVE